MTHDPPCLWSRRRFVGRMMGKIGTIAFCLIAFALGPPARTQDAPARRPNVLFIAVDDLRPALGCYGDKIVKSPHIDKLAARGVVFGRAYCQQAVCAPSRNSLLTGRRPDTIGIYNLGTNFRTKLPDVVTLPQQFKQNGYHTESMGKIFHTGHGNHDDERSWSVPSWGQGTRKPAPPQTTNRDAPLQLAAFVQAPVPNKRAPKQNGPAWGAPDKADSDLFDGKLADHAIERIGTLKNDAKPFFLAVGFLKPHLPFIAPKRYWDQYDPAQFTLAPTTELPKNAPPYAGNGVGELSMYAGIPKKGPLSDDLARQLMHGYYACISYVDAQVGRLLAELDKQGLRDNTIVILWGDHGWQLGEHGMWAKHNAYEHPTRAPLIASAPGRRAAGQTSNALVEFVDIYPSLCELAGVPKSDGLEGTSFVPLLSDPKRPWKKAAFSQWPKKIPGQGDGMAHSLRTERYRLTEWTIADKPDFRALELYDYQTDPNETVNLAGLPEHAALVATLKTQLRAGWREALPRS